MKRKYKNTRAPDGTVSTISNCDWCTNCSCNCCHDEKIFASDQELRNIGVDSIGQNPDGSCTLLKDGLCTVYEKRPFECKLYPFDIESINGKYMWIIWESCPPDSIPDLEEAVCFLESTLLVNYSMEYIDNYIEFHKEVEPNYVNLPFTVIREIRFPSSR